MRWCLGYVGDQELVAFLKKCKYWLKQYKNSKGSSKERIAYIIILDNVAVDGKEYDAGRGQWVRSKEKIEHLFKLAQLTKILTIFPHKLHREYETVMAWGLCGSE